jgi:hypothetical protein
MTKSRMLVTSRFAGLLVLLIAGGYTLLKGRAILRQLALLRRTLP